MSHSTDFDKNADNEQGGFIPNVALQLQQEALSESKLEEKMAMKQSLHLWAVRSTKTHRANLHAHTERTLERLTSPMWATPWKLPPNIWTWRPECASLIAAAKSAEGEPEKNGADEIFPHGESITNTALHKEIPSRDLHHPSEEGDVKTVEAAWPNSMGMPKRTPPQSYVRYRSWKKPVQVTKPQQWAWKQSLTMKCGMESPNRGGDRSSIIVLLQLEELVMILMGKEDGWEIQKCFCAFE